MARGTAGLTADKLHLQNDQLDLTADGTFATGRADFDFDMALADLALLSDRASGRLTASGRANGTDGLIGLTFGAEVAEGTLVGKPLRNAALGFEGTLQNGDVNGQVTGDALLEEVRVMLASAVSVTPNEKRLGDLTFTAGGARLTGDVTQRSDGLLDGRLRLDADDISTAAALLLREASGALTADVMLTPDGRTKLMDLGIARNMDGESITHASSILGTAGYVSPEQARGDPVDHRSDIYSLGCVLYEMLTGRQPFEAQDPLAMAYKHVHEAPVPPTSLEPSIPPALEAVTLRAMEKQPGSRFQNVEEMASALDDRTAPVAPLTTTTPMPPVPATAPLPKAHPDTLPRRADRARRRRPLVPLLLGLAALALLGGLAYALFGNDPPAGRAGPPHSPGPSVSPSSSPSRSPSPSPTPATVDPVQEAVAALQAVVAQAVSDGTISDKAAREIQKGLDEALHEFAGGDTEKATEKLGDLEGKIDELVDHDEIAHSEEQKLDKAIEDLAAQMFEAAPSED